MRNVFVAGAAGTPKNQNIIKEAAKLGTLLAEAGATYLQGGCLNGVMGATFKEFIKKSDNVWLYYTSFYHENDVKVFKNYLGEEKYAQLNEKVFKSEKDRLMSVIQCDDIIVMPGGFGTLEELLFCNETRRANEHNANIIIVNVDGFYNGFLEQMRKNIDEELSSEKAIHFEVVSSVDEIDFLKK